MRIEKEIIHLTELHQKTEKRKLIENLNRVLKEQGIHRNQKIQWVCEVTGSPTGTAYTWFTNAKCRSVNKMPLYALCRIAVETGTSVYDFLEMDYSVPEDETLRIDRRSKLYWHLRWEVAEDLWNSTHDSGNRWQEQTMKVRRDFLDSLYLQKVKEETSDSGIE